MDFNIKSSGTKLMVRVGPSKESNVDLFCSEYKRFLMEAKKNNIKLRVLFDLRLASMQGLQSCSSKLANFFGHQIQRLSEDVLETCIVVVPNELLEKGIKLIFDCNPGKVPTTFTCKFPRVNLDDQTGG